MQFVAWAVLPRTAIVPTAVLLLQCCAASLPPVEATAVVPMLLLALEACCQCRTSHAVSGTQHGLTKPYSQVVVAYDYVGICCTRLIAVDQQVQQRPVAVADTKLWGLGRDQV